MRTGASDVTVRRVLPASATKPSSTMLPPETRTNDPSLAKATAASGHQSSPHSELPVQSSKIVTFAASFREWLRPWPSSGHG